MSKIIDVPIEFAEAARIAKEHADSAYRNAEAGHWVSVAYQAERLLNLANVLKHNQDEQQS